MPDLGITGGQTDWYALQVKARWEQSIAKLLSGKGFKTLLPTYEAERPSGKGPERVERPLFPGYLFCRFDVLNRLPILVTQGVISIVRRGRIPIAVEPSEIAAIERLVAVGARMEPHAYIPVGELVRVECGPLKDLLGILIAYKGSQRVLVSVSLLQRSVTVEIDRASLSAVRKPISEGTFPESERDPSLELVSVDSHGRERHV